MRLVGVYVRGKKSLDIIQMGYEAFYDFREYRISPKRTDHIKWCYDGVSLIVLAIESNIQSHSFEEKNIDG